MASIGSLSVDLALESANFLAGLKKSAEATESAAHRIEAAMDLAKEATKAFIGAWTVDKVAERIDQAFEYGARMVDISNKTGASTKSIQEFSFAMRQQGASAETAEGAIGKFSKALGQAQNGNAKMANLLKSLGVTSFTDFEGALNQTMEGLGKLPSQVSKNADALKLFGKSGGAAAAVASQGADAYKELSEEAEKFGIVLDDHVLHQAKEAEDKISLLKQVLAADITNAVLQNADSIAKFTDGLVSLVSMIPKVISGLSAMKNYFAELNLDRPDWMKVGYDYKQGFVGAKESNTRDEHILLGSHDGRTAIYNRERDAYEKARASGDTAAANEHLGKARYAKHLDMVGEAKPTNPFDGHDAPVVKPAKEKKEHDDNGMAYAKATRQYDKEIASAKMALATTAEEKFSLESAGIEQDRKDRADEIERNKKFTAAQKSTLLAANDNLSKLKLEAAQRDESDALIKETYDIEIQKRGFIEDGLRSEQALAKTQSERRALALQLLDLEYKDKNDKLKTIIETSHDQTQIDAAMRDQDHLAQQHAADVKATRQSTQGPLEQWMAAIPKSAAEMNEALQNVEVQGLNNLSDGLMSVIEGTKSLGEAFSDMAKSVINDLIKIGLQKAVIGPLANALFGGSSDGGVGGLLGSLLGHRANGGMTAPGTYEVGERGPELVNIGSNANVTTARQIQGAANDNAGHHITFGPGSIVSNDPERVRAMVVEGIASALPVITKQSTDRTLKQAGRRNL